MSFSYKVITLQNSKFCYCCYLPTCHMEFFQVSNPTYVFLEIGRTCSIIITIIGSITVLLSDNVICFGYFMPMSHGVNKKAPTNVLPPPLPPTRFSPVLFVVLQERLYQPVSSYLTDYCKKKCIFKVRQNFSYNLLLVDFDFAVLCLCVSQGAFSRFLFAYMHSFLFGLSSNHNRSGTTEEFMVVIAMV